MACANPAANDVAESPSRRGLEAAPLTPSFGRLSTPRLRRPHQLDIADMAQCNGLAKAELGGEVCEPADTERALTAPDDAAKFAMA